MYIRDRSDLGAILYAETAVKTGIIDHLGGLDDAFDELVRLIDLERK
ncbi:MAG: hypothetical protein IJS17_04050 [Clostridia bacterium]|nr:hypothetical protein [Clostridia bacterium]